MLLGNRRQSEVQVQLHHLLAVTIVIPFREPDDGTSKRVLEFMPRVLSSATTRGSNSREPYPRFHVAEPAYGFHHRIKVYSCARP
jgi:hypothetical protein